MTSLRCWSLPSVLLSVLVTSLAAARDADEVKKTETEKRPTAVRHFAGMLHFSERQQDASVTSDGAASDLRKRVERLEREVEQLKARLGVLSAERSGGPGTPEGLAGDRKAVTQRDPNPQQPEIDRLRELGAKVSVKDGQVVEVNLTNSIISDTDMELLSSLANLELLTLNGCSNITNAGLVYLMPLTGLKGLALERTNITDAGLENLKGLTELSLLSLNWTRVGDAGLKHLADLKKLGVLYLCATQTADAGVAALKNMAQLSWLDLRQTQVTDAGLKHLSGLTRMRLLCLYGIPMTDAGIAPLTKLSNLEQLTLNQTQVTDAGLLRLAKLPKLHELNIRGTRVTERGIQQVQQALPDCKIDLNKSPRYGDK